MTLSRPSSILPTLALLSTTACFNPPPIAEDSDDSSGTGPGPATDASTDASTAPEVTTTATDSMSTGAEVDSSGEPGPVCGDGAVDDGEACDDANFDDGDGCDDACNVEVGYACTGEPSGCDPICGDGVVLDGEGCDDANLDDGDGCSAACAEELDHQCEGEPSVCTYVGCGDGVLGGPEACDDGNERSGDGCTDECSVEPFYRCEGEGPGSCARIRLLYAPADGDDPTFRTVISTHTGALVDYFDARAGTPALDVLEADYDCVFTHPNDLYFDPVAFGNGLASFVDGGGNVVLGIAAANPSFGLVGSTILTPAYAPVTSVDIDFLDAVTMYAGDGTSVIHAGVINYGTPILDDGVVLQGAGIQDATFDNGSISSAYRPDFKVVYLNGTGNQSVNAPGQWPRLFANACAAGFGQ